MKILNPQQIIVKRADIEQELVEILEQTSSNFTLNTSRTLFTIEEGTNAMTDIITMFDTGQKAVKLQNIVELINDTGNYFPHKILDVLSPAKKVLEYNIPVTGIFEQSA